MHAVCLFCGGDASERDHWQHCDGRQGAIEAAIEAAIEPEPEPEPMRQTAYDREAAAFHEQNPHVFAKLLESARELKGAGVQKAGIKLIFERLRWINVIETEGDKYRLNDHYTAWYARRVMAEDPALLGLFVTRASAHDPEYYDRPIRRRRKADAG